MSWKRLKCIFSRKIDHNQAFEVFFTFPKRKHDLIWSDFMLMKWKNTFLKRFPCLQHKKHVFETLFMFTKWKKVLKCFCHVYKTKIAFLKRFSCLKMEKHLLEAFFMFTKWETTYLKRFSCLQNEKKTFRSVFHAYKLKKQLFEAFWCI